MIVFNGLLPGIRAFPSFPFIIFGEKSLLKYFWVCLQVARYYFAGHPKHFIIMLNCSCSFYPAKRGYPKASSAMRHPKLQISMGNEYFPPSITSGAL
jgi:hypothetical protein